MRKGNPKPGAMGRPGIGVLIPLKNGVGKAFLKTFTLGELKAKAADQFGANFSPADATAPRRVCTTWPATAFP